MSRSLLMINRFLSFIYFFTFNKFYFYKFSNFSFLLCSLFYQIVFCSKLSLLLAQYVDDKKSFC